MATKWWEAAPVVEASPPQQGGGVFVPDQGAIDDARRAETGLGVQVQGGERAEAGQQFTQTQGLRKEFDALPDVTKYREAVTALDTGLFTKPDGSGDGTLLYQYSKLMDPIGSVREGDVQLAQSGAGYLSAKATQLKKDFGIGSGGTLPPEIREGLRREMISRFNSLNRSYSQQRQHYRRLAEQYGYSPENVIGEHAGAPFLERFRSYDKAHGLGEYSAEAKARAQGEQAREDYRPNPDEIVFGMDLPGSQSTEGSRIKPENEAAWSAYLQAAGPSFDPDQANRFLKSLGEPGSLSFSPEFIDAVRSGEAFPTNIDYSQSDEARRKAALEASYKVVPEGSPVSSYGLDKGISLNLSDELMGLSGGIHAAMTGGDFGQGYDRERDIERALQQRSREAAGLAPELVGGLLAPAGVISRANLARDAAAMGAIAGFGEGEGTVDSLAKTVTGTALGYGGGKAIDAAAPFVVSKAAPIVERVKDAVTKPGQREFVDAAERQGLDYMAADIPGNTGTRMATSLSKMTLGGVPIADRATKIIEGAVERKAEIARSLSPAADVQAGGQAIKRGASEWAASAKDKASKLHEAIPIRPNQPAFTKNTYQALNEINAGLASNRALSGEIADAAMQRFQAALEDKGLSWSDLKKFRSYVGELAGRPSVSQTMSKSDLKKLYAGLSEDMRATASLVGPDAERALARANDYTRGMEQRREEVLTSLLGKNYDKSDEAAFNQIQSWARKDSGDWSKLSRAMRSLPDADANVVRATIIDRLGMAKKGGQDAAGEVFSPSEFMTQWNGLDKRAKAILFQGDQRKALDDLATYFDGLKSASQQFANTSRTGLITNAVATAGVLGIDLVTGAMASIGQLGAGKFLASPTFAKWMSALVKKPNPAAMLQHVERLTAVARAEPVIANDIFTLQQRLAEQFQKSPGALAAEDTGDGRREPPAQGERNGAQ